MSTEEPATQAMHIVAGSIFDADVDAIVNPVNCVGVMGRGLAAQFKRAYPDNFVQYAAVCQRGELRPGRALVVATGQAGPRWIVNLPTKRHWRDPSLLQDIDSGLDALLVVHHFRLFPSDHTNYQFAAAKLKIRESHPDFARAKLDKHSKRMPKR